MDTLTKTASFTLVVKSSRFVSELLPCNSQAAARDTLRAQKARYKDATHVVHAFIVGEQGQVRGMSDDGEPGGTAARPVMDVLMGRKCTNVMLTVTRWFGGTLLGTGGLVKAYGDAAKGVIAAADGDGAFTELVKMTSISFDCDYAAYDKVRMLIARSRVRDLKEQYASRVSVSALLPDDDIERFGAALRDETSGRAALRIAQ